MGHRAAHDALCMKPDEGHENLDHLDTFLSFTNSAESDCRITLSQSRCVAAIMHPLFLAKGKVE